MTKSKIIIGVDESGKGDFFGSLVIAAIAVPEADEKKLTDLEVRDSKLIADKKLQLIADRLLDLYPYEILIIPPDQYNLQYKKIKNLNKLLAWGHAETIERLCLKTKADIAISDKFGKTELIENELSSRGVDIDLQQLVQGERKLPVAAASILARSAFLDEMTRLSEESGMTLPRGASAQVDEAGRDIVKKYGPGFLEKIAKIHFKNYIRSTSHQLF